MSDEIASRLQHVRQMYGLSQRELAKRAGVTNSSVSMIEQGRVSPSFSSLEKLLKGIPMTVKDFFNLDFKNELPSFYRGFEMYKGSRNHIDSYCLSAESGEMPSDLIYQVYNPDSGTGESMIIAQKKCSGFIVQGIMQVTINNQCQHLEAGDGFVVQPLFLYRLQNDSKEKAIVVMTNHVVEQN